MIEIINKIKIYIIKLFKIYIIKLFLYFIDWYKDDLRVMYFENNDQTFKNDERIKFWKIINKAVENYECNTEICNLCGIGIYNYRGPMSQDKYGYTCANCSLNVCNYRCATNNSNLKILDQYVYEDIEYSNEDIENIDQIYNCPFCGQYKLNKNRKIIKLY